jgi:hypothetical protein
MRSAGAEPVAAPSRDAIETSATRLMGVDDSSRTRVVPVFDA